MAMFGLEPAGPVIRWQPHEGQRHAYRPGETAALCGDELVVRKASEREWFDDTCPECRRTAWVIVNPGIPYPVADASPRPRPQRRRNRGRVA
ncbi:zinc finger protein [Saccharopolyspora shandongensis]|uniref:zinc finger protein n=1 Tax=Saccharopolyspora shandongensis TaxID=418495 RepID=UPI003CCBA1A8